MCVGCSELRNRFTDQAGVANNESQGEEQQLAGNFNLPSSHIELFSKKEAEQSSLLNISPVGFEVCLFVCKMLVSKCQSQ